LKDAHVVGEAATGYIQLVPRAVVIEVTVIIVVSQGEVSFARIWLQAKGGIDGGFRQLEALRGAIVAVKIIGYL
jgi:hypothetical protein